AWRLERYGQELGLAWRPLLAVLIGSGCLVLLGIVSPFPWVTVWIGPRDFNSSDGMRETGLETHQGKVICVAVLLAVGSLGLGLFFVRRLLGACMLGPGAS